MQRALKGRGSWGRGGVGWAAGRAHSSPRPHPTAGSEGPRLGSPGGQSRSRDGPSSVHPDMSDLARTRRLPMTLWGHCWAPLPELVAITSGLSILCL